MVGMVARFRDSYHFDGGLEQAVVDLVRVGSTGFGAGVRQLATRLVRAVPPGVSDPASFRVAVHEALAQSAASPGLRFAPGEMPSDDGGEHSLVDVDGLPDGFGLILTDQTMKSLEEIVRERRLAAKLARSGVDLSRTVLLSGPPGVGKTMAARWLAQQIAIPLVTMNLSAVVSSFLGSSGRNIRSVLDYASSGACVLLLDEFDAIAKRRDDDTDIGELKRVVSVILVELDRWSSASLLVAATNHLQLLDPAVGRRFDRHIKIELPGAEERERILTCLAADPAKPGERVLSLVAEMTEGMSGSDLTRLWNTARRRAVLYDHEIGDELLREIAAPLHSKGATRDRLWLMLNERLGMSTRQIAASAGVSHPTVSSAISRARASR
jgi:SpoVK/Ycf46/Vps4 family AAA+-type ATPase